MSDPKTMILLLAAGQGLLLSLALISQYRKSKSNVFFGIIIFVAAVEILFDFAIRIRYPSPGAFPFWYFGSYLLWPPALWLFFRLNLSGSFKVRQTHLLLFVPALVEMLGEFAVTLLYQKFNILIELGLTWFILGEVVPLTGIILVMFLYSRDLLRVRKKNTKVNLPVVAAHLRKHYFIFTVFLFLSLLWLTLTLSDSGIISWFDYSAVFTVVEILLVSSIFLLGYLTYIKPTFFEIPKAFGVKTEEPGGYTQYSDHPELNRLNDLLTREKLYAMNKLSLNDLADKLCLPPRYVSYLINTYHQTNFHDYINGFRVKEVITKISDPQEQHKTLLALALEAGFNSKSTFNQVFKSHTGKTPSSYLSDIRSKNMFSDVRKSAIG